MKIRVLILLLFTLSSCSTEMLSSNGNPIASPTRRPSLPKVDPITVNGKKYGGGFNEGALPIANADTGKLIKTVPIYRYPDNSSAVFFKSMKLVNDKQDILIETELGDKFLFNLKTEKVSAAKGNKGNAMIAK